MTRRHPPPPSSLPRFRAAIPGLGAIRVATASHDVAQAIDASWLEHRREQDHHLAWSWAEIISDMQDAFIVHADDRPIAVWASTQRTSITLEGRKYYRLDFFEIDPLRRGDRTVSPLVLGLIAKRAKEVKAVGIVLASFPVPGLVERYRALGASHGVPRGWNLPAELVPLTFEQAALDRLYELVDAIQEKPHGSLP